jgi:hypothetical protein
MFCPECKSEYREGFTRCSDCNVALVSALLPEEMDCHGDGQVTVFVTRDMVEAETVKEVLESNDIEVFISGENSPLPGFPTEVRLIVCKEQADFAHEILEEFSEEEDRNNVVPFPLNPNEGTT